VAVQCPQCGRQYDVTLFEFQRTLDCDCGTAVDLGAGHTLHAGSTLADGLRWASDETPAQGNSEAAIAPATWDYLRAPHIAWDYDRYFRHNELFRFDVRVLDRWFATPGRLLDLGCGTGRHVVHFAARGFQVTGLDLSEHMLAAARAKLDAAGSSATIVRADIARLDETGLGPFDYAICMFSTLGMIHGAANRQRLLESVRRHLAPGGLFALHLHNRWQNLWDPDGRRYLWHALRNHWRGQPEAFEKDMDGYRGIRGLRLYVYSERELRGVLECAGFQVAEFLHLNHPRNGVLRGLAKGLRSNGFIVLCRAAERA